MIHIVERVQWIKLWIKELVLVSLLYGMDVECHQNTWFLRELYRFSKLLLVSDMFIMTLRMTIVGLIVQYSTIKDVTFVKIEVNLKRSIKKRTYNNL